MKRSLKHEPGRIAESISDAIIDDPFLDILPVVAIHHVLKGEFAQTFADIRVDLIPYLTRGAEGRARTFLRQSDTAHDGQGAFHDLNDIQQGDLGRFFEDFESTLGPADGADHAGTAQIDNQAADILF